VNYHDHKRAFELNNKEMYLNFLIYLMSGITKSNTGRMGQIPRLLLPVLTNKTAIGYFRRHDRKMKSLIKEYFDTRHLPSQKIRKCRMIMRFFLK
jgi:hypothetical protein